MAKPRHWKPAEVAFDIANTLFMALVIIIMAYPFWYVLCYSFSDPVAAKTGGLILFPRGFSLDAYAVCLSNPDIVNSALISVGRTVIGAITMIVISSMAAFVLTKNNLLGIRFFRVLFLFTMYFSGGIIPLYMVIKGIGLTGSFLVYILPAAANVFNMMLIRAYMESLPASLEESAVISGASDLTVFFRIIFPLCMPVIAAVALFACVGQWNSYVDTQLYNYKNPELYPLQYILFNYLMAYTPTRETAKQQAIARVVTPQSMKMAITIITIVPILFVYPFLQRYFISGILIGSVKG